MRAELEELQIKMAYLEDYVATLNKVILQLQGDHQNFAKELQDIQNQQAAQASVIADLRDETLPPHY